MITISNFFLELVINIWTRFVLSIVKITRSQIEEFIYAVGCCILFTVMGVVVAAPFIGV
jgi:hypothetical protein